LSGPPPPARTLFSSTPLPPPDLSVFARNRNTGSPSHLLADAGAGAGAAPATSALPLIELERPISPLAEFKADSTSSAHVTSTSALGATASASLLGDTNDSGAVQELRRQLAQSTKKLNSYKTRLQAAQNRLDSYKSAEYVKNWDKLTTLATTNEQLRSQLKACCNPTTPTCVALCWTAYRLRWTDGKPDLLCVCCGRVSRRL
jgi:hypothetical protein